ncbi:insulinase family protein [Marinobacterium sp. D7]|uniref:insulinase family protein n=1 Tax=Marinobacterium ramblicola TaxID=2849041 RepID=UPI001C2D24E4|nr:insulinase family protein [Marinobacterium ramblicola]MBV1789076.1 insulinase family protein [Marinobacterium ramblicola]
MQRLSSRLVQFTLLIFIVLALPVRAALPIQSPNDSRQYEVFSLPNRLQVVVVSDPNTDKGAASLAVQAGSGDDPKGREGLAHFLEHMLFLGTEKYPEADAYQQFISANGGSHNAYTAFDHTNYFFDVKADALPDALDRFAQFFIAPLFTPEYVDRERHAVHSEFKAKIRDDGRRLYVAGKLAMNPDHPYSRFAVGSLDTLADRPDSPVRDDLIKFYNSHYSANLMTLAVVGRQSTAELRRLVEERFSAVADRNLEALDIKASLYKTAQLPIQLDVVTLMQTRQLELSFPIKPIRQYWDKKPVNYIASLIGYEGKGSLLSLLKQKGWAQALGASAGIDLDHQASFDVGIELTKAGLEHYNEVVELFFSYVDALKDAGVRRELYQEEAQLAATDFRFREPREPIHEVTNLSLSLARYPSTHLLDAPYRYSDFDPELIESYLEQLTPDRLVLLRAAQNLPTDQRTPLYEIDYRLGKPDRQALTRWHTPKPDQQLYARGPNPFVAQNLELLAASDSADQQPQRIWQREGGELWFLRDTSFGVPRANLYLALLSGSANASPKTAVLNELSSRMLKDRLNEVLYDASLAGLSADIYDHARGISLRLAGYNDRMPLLLDAILDAAKQSPSSEARFARIKQALSEELENARKEKPYTQTFSTLYRSLMPQWTEEEQLDALAPLTLADLQAYWPALFNDVHLRGLAHGNLTEEAARQMAQQVYDTLLNDRPAAATPRLPVVQLPAGRTLHTTLQIDHNDSALTLYMQGQNTELETRAEVALLNEILATPFYNQLRTEQQLGYIVFANYLPLSEVPGLTLVVQSPVADPIQLERAYNLFLEQMQSALAELPEQALEGFRRSLISRIDQRDNSLKERTSRFWRELDRENTAFDTPEKMIAAVQQVTREQLGERLKQLRSRQLAVRSFGNENNHGDSGSDDRALLDTLKADQRYVPGSAALP